MSANRECSRHELFGLQTFFVRMHAHGIGELCRPPVVGHQNVLTEQSQPVAPDVR
jgi:hypothetical protein